MELLSAAALDEALGQSPERKSSQKVTLILASVVASVFFKKVFVARLEIFLQTSLSKVKKRPFLFRQIMVREEENKKYLVEVTHK